MSINIRNTLSVATPIEQAWLVLNDIKRVASCVPGAELTEVVDDNTYKGRVTVRLGPVQLAFGGTVEFRERDAVRHRAVIRATGNELKGRGSARALVTCSLHPEDATTRVDVDTALDLAGQVAQYGRGAALIASVAQQLVKDFADALAADMRAATGADQTPPPGPRREIHLVSLIARGWWHGVLRWLRSVLGGSAQT